MKTGPTVGLSQKCSGVKWTFKKQGIPVLSCRSDTSWARLVLLRVADIDVTPFEVCAATTQAFLFQPRFSYSFCFSSKRRNPPLCCSQVSKLDFSQIMKLRLSYYSESLLEPCHLNIILYKARNYLPVTSVSWMKSFEQFHLNLPI